MATLRWLAVALALPLAACAWKVTLMPRDSGKTYAGTLEDDRESERAATVTIDGVTYSGSAAKSARNESFGFLDAESGDSKGVLSAFVPAQADPESGQYLKATLSSPDGRRLRCDLLSGTRGGGGICVGDDRRIYDVEFRRP